MNKKHNKTIICISAMIISLFSDFIGTALLKYYPNSVLGAVFLFLGIVVFTVSALYLLISAVKSIQHKATKKADVQYEHNHAALSENQAVAVSPAYSSGKAISKTDQKLTWVAIAFVFTLLPPIGIFYAIKKILTEKDNLFKNSTTLITIGIILSILAAIPFFSFGILTVMKGKSFSRAEIIFFLVFATVFVMCLLVIIIGIYLRNQAIYQQELLHMLVVDKITNLNTLAEKMHCKKAKLYHTIDEFINSGTLIGAYFDPESEEVIILSISDKIAIRCHTCAATTVLKANEENKRCIYCGAKL